MSKKKELLDHIIVHSWMSERMNLEYPELYVYAAFYTAGDAGILAAEYVTAKMAKLCGVSVSTFYKARNNLLIMGLLFSQSFSGMKRVYYVTEREMPLPLVTEKKESSSMQEKFDRKTKSSAPLLQSNDPETSSKTSSKDEEKMPVTKSIQYPKDIFTGLRKVIDLIIKHRNEALSIISVLRDGMSNNIAELSGSINELRKMSDELHSWGDDPESESASELFQEAEGENVATKEGSFPDEEKETPDFIKKLSPEEFNEMWDWLEDKIWELFEDDNI